MIRGPTITRIFAVMITASLIAMAAFLWGFSSFSETVIFDTAKKRRADAAAQVEKNVVFELGRMDRRITAISEQIHTEAINPNDPVEIERVLHAALLEEPQLSEASFTHVMSSGWDEDGQIIAGPVGRWQVAVYRDGVGTEAPIFGRWTYGRSETDWEALVERIDHGGSASEKIACTDPTTHPTFSVAASREYSGQVLRSDLHSAEHGSLSTRPIVVTSQRALLNSDRVVYGVLKIGLDTRQIDLAVRAVDLPKHHLFLAAMGTTGATIEELTAATRLLTSSMPGEAIHETENDFRFETKNAPTAVQHALALPEFQALTVKNPNVETPKEEVRTVTAEFKVNGESHLLTASNLAGTLGWVVGIVVPTREYTAELRKQRLNNLFIFGGVALGLILLAVFSMRAVRNGLNEVQESTQRMLRYDFAATEPRTGLVDLSVVLRSLERAKTALRSLGKYAPVDLVKQLYANNVEPRLGGEQVEVSVMFTDLKGFTELSEKLSTDALAEALGQYLQTMTQTIQGTGGTIDKFIGDAIMALWNVPTAIPNHPLKACEAILKCRAATEALYQSAGWSGEPLVTRFGLHTDKVMVGHFGAPERMSFTALGDGVNLAARLESLCKLYGVTNLVSEAIVELAKGEYEFRFVDQVAVKGKAKPVKVFEILGRREETSPRPPLETYARAWQLYSERQFDQAAQLFSTVKDVDGPAGTLHARCVFLSRQPPGPEWRGVHVLSEK